MEKIAIIGANESILSLIEKAKEKGYETHVFAWACGDPGETAADVFYPISIAEKERICEICRQIGIVGVCSITSDFAAPTVNYIARALGLTANPEITETIARNKYEMRNAFKAAGLYTPPYRKVGCDFQVESITNLHYPIIVKPTDRWSSKGVTRVNEFSQLEEAIRVAVRESFDHEAILEGFMDGPEYSAECIVYQKECTVLAITEKSTTGYPHYIENGHKQPAPLSEKTAETARETVKKAVTALHIENGAAHAEFRILDNGEIGIIEIGARMGGDCIGTDLTPISTGMDYIGMVVDIACGKAPDFRIVTKPSPVEIRFIMTEDDVAFLDEQREKRDFVRIHEEDRDFGREVTDSSKRHGYFIYRVEQ